MGLSNGVYQNFNRMEITISHLLKCMLLVSHPDWNTLIVGKLSPWIEVDSELTTMLRNSEAVS